MTESRKINLAKNTGILAIGTFLPKAATFVTLPLLTAFLTKEEYGSYDLIITIASLLLPAATLQIQTAAFRFLIDKRNDPEQEKAIISSSFAFVVPVSVLTLAVYYVVTSILLSGSMDWVVRLLACGYYFVYTLSNEALQCMRGLGHNKQYSISCVLTAAMQLALTVLLIAFWRLGLRGAILVLLLAGIVALVYQIAVVRLHRYIGLKSIDAKLVREMLAYSWPLVPNQLSGWVMRLSNRLVITIFMGAAANGVFAVAYKIPQVIALGQNTFTMAWQENASIANKDGDAKVYYSDMFDTVIRVSAGLTALIIAATPVLFMILVQGDYSDAYAQIPVLMFSMYWVWIATFFSGIYVAYKKTVNSGMSMTVAAIVNLVIDIVAVPRIGLYGASVAYLVSYMGLAFFRMIDVQRICKVDCRLPLLFAVAGVLVMQCGLLGMATPWIDVLNAVLGVCVCVFLNRKTGRHLFAVAKRRLGR